MPNQTTETSNAPAKRSTASRSRTSSHGCLSVAVAVLAIIIGGSYYLYQNENYVFDQAVLQQIARREIARNQNRSTQVRIPPS